MTALRLLAAATALVLSACVTSVPSPSASPAASVAPPPTPSHPTSDPSPSPSAGLALPEPGRPFDADDLLQAMRDSRRPGGVPAELQDAGIAAALAERLWTFDGEPWDTVVAGGACDGSSCSLELSGSTATAAGEDVWIFAIDASTGAVELVNADLHSLPAETADALDRTARALDEDDLLEELLTTAVRWLPPPAEDRFRIAYRSGNEEESCAVDLELDAAAGRITELVPTGC